MDIGGSGLTEVVAEYENFRLGREIDGETYLAADAAWFRGIVGGVVKDQKAIDPVIHQSLTDTWPLARIDSTLRATLRAAVFELMHRRDPAILCVARAGEADWLPIHQNFAARWLVDTGQRLDNRRLTRTVITKKAKHFAFAHLQADFMQDVDGTEGLVNVAKFENRFFI